MKKRTIEELDIAITELEEFIRMCFKCWGSGCLNMVQCIYCKGSGKREERGVC